MKEAIRVRLDFMVISGLTEVSGHTTLFRTHGFIDQAQIVGFTPFGTQLSTGKSWFNG